MFLTLIQVKSSWFYLIVRFDETIFFLLFVLTTFWLEYSTLRGEWKTQNHKQANWLYDLKDSRIKSLWFKISKQFEYDVDLWLQFTIFFCYRNYLFDLNKILKFLYTPTALFSNFHYSMLKLNSSHNSSSALLGALLGRRLSLVGLSRLSER